MNNSLINSGSCQHTYENAEKLGLRGWCMNTNNGTVKGKLEGPLKAIEAM